MSEHESVVSDSEPIWTKLRLPSLDPGVANLASAGRSSDANRYENLQCDLGKLRAEQDLENAKRAVAQLVRTSYLGVTSGAAQVKAFEASLVSSKSSLDSTLLGKEVGVRTNVDVLNSQQQLFQTRRDLQQARYNTILAQLRLKAAAGRLTEDDLAEINRLLAR